MDAEEAHSIVWTVRVAVAPVPLDRHTEEKKTTNGISENARSLREIADCQFGCYCQPLSVFRSMEMKTVKSRKAVKRKALRGHRSV